MALRLGLLSTARINHSLLVAARAGDAVTVVAVASREPASAAGYARRNGIATAHGAYQALLDDPAIDAVYISLPNSLHVEWTLRALAAGKHVLCEKPLASKGADAERVVSAAADAGLVLAEAFMYRHHPQTQALARLASSGELGRLRRVRAWFAFPAELPGDAVVLDRDLEGGALRDVGCYCVSAARLLAGEPQYATAEAMMGSSGVDLRVRGRLEFAAGVVAELEAAIDLPDRVGVEVEGESATALVADPWHCLQPGIELRPGAPIAVASGDPYRLQLDDFAAAVHKSRPARVSGAEIVGQARVLEALDDSVRRGGARVRVATDSE